MGVIYEIINKKTDKTYVGKTINFNNRVSNHKSLLKSGEHPNKNLQHDYDSFGESNFEFNIITNVDNDILKYYEKKIIDEKEISNGVHNIKGVRDCDENFLLEIIEKEKKANATLEEAYIKIKEMVIAQIENLNIKYSNLNFKEDDLKLIELTKDRSALYTKDIVSYFHNKYSLVAPIKFEKILSNENKEVNNICDEIIVEVYDRVVRMVNRYYGKIIKINQKSNLEKIDSIKFIYDDAKLKKYHMEVKIDYRINAETTEEYTVKKKIKIR